MASLREFGIVLEIWRTFNLLTGALADEDEPTAATPAGTSRASSARGALLPGA